MKRSDLFREYARVIDLCEGTKVSPLKCVRFRDTIFDEEPEFTGNPIENYTFAVAIIEDRPVFAGDVLYTETNYGVSEKYVVSNMTQNHLENGVKLTWTKPDESNTVKLSNVFGLSNEIIKVKLTKSGTGKISAEVVE